MMTYISCRLKDYLVNSNSDEEYANDVNKGEAERHCAEHSELCRLVVAIEGCLHHAVPSRIVANKHQVNKGHCPEKALGEMKEINRWMRVQSSLWVVIYT